MQPVNLNLVLLDHSLGKCRCKPCPESCVYQVGSLTPKKIQGICNGIRKCNLEVKLSVLSEKTVNLSCLR